MQQKNSPVARLSAFLRSCLWWDRPFARNVMILALPMVLQELVGASLHIFDGLMVSGLGDAAYSAVTQANRFTFLFQLFVFGVASGGAIFLSQYWGARDIPRMRHAMGLALALSFALSLLFSLVALLLPRQIMSFFLPAGESLELSINYLSIVAPSYLLLALSHVYAAAHKAAEKTYIPMLAGLISIVVDTILNYALIYGKLGFPAMGVDGAALSTVIAAVLSLSINVSFAYIKKLPAGAKPRELICRDLVFAKSFFKTVVPVIFNEGLWALGTTMYGVFYGTMGDSNIAAVGVNNSIGDLMWVFVFGATNAAAIMVGKALGQGDRDRAYLYSKRLLTSGVVLGALLGLLMLIFHTPLVGLFTGLSQEARDKAQLVLIFSSMFLWLRAFNCINVVGLLRSGGDTVFSLILDAGAMWAIAVPAVGIAAVLLHWPIQYVYLCTLLDELLKLFIGIPHFKGKKWMNILTQSKEDNALGNA